MADAELPQNVGVVGGEVGDEQVRRGDVADHPAVDDLGRGLQVGPVGVVASGDDGGCEDPVEGWVGLPGWPAAAELALAVRHGDERFAPGERLLRVQAQDQVSAIARCGEHVLGVVVVAVSPFRDGDDHELFVVVELLLGVREHPLGHLHEAGVVRGGGRLNDVRVGRRGAGVEHRRPRLALVLNGRLPKGVRRAGDVDRGPDAGFGGGLEHEQIGAGGGRPEEPAGPEPSD